MPIEVSPGAIDQLETVVTRLNEAYAITELLMMRHYDYNKPNLTEMISAFASTGHLVGLLGDILRNQIDAITVLCPNRA